MGRAGASDTDWQPASPTVALTSTPAMIGIVLRVPPLMARRNACQTQQSAQLVMRALLIRMRPLAAHARGDFRGRARHQRTQCANALVGEPRQRAGE